MTCANSVLPAYMGDPRGIGPENVADARFRVQVDTTQNVANVPVLSITSAFTMTAQPDSSESA